ncbi:MAG: hypothetical protein R3C08_00400 [Hyphomonas sp.]|nr:hypothetical protein [Hyphomonas sp.]HRX72481.1 hypothetical protein [Hyphomonas sp.]
MLVPPIRLSSSLGLAWAFARRRAAQLAEAFDLGPRAVHRALDGELTGLETLVHRILFLVAMGTPLPRWTGPVGARKTVRPVRKPAPVTPDARLFDRFSALRLALAEPDRQVARLRQKLARIRADKSLPLPLADKPPPACTGPKTRPVARELYWALHDAALSWLPLLDSG